MSQYGKLGCKPGVICKRWANSEYPAIRALSPRITRFSRPSYERPASKRVLWRENQVHIIAKGNKLTDPVTGRRYSLIGGRNQVLSSEVVRYESAHSGRRRVRGKD